MPDKRIERDDVHRPGLIVPEDYKYLLSYSYPGPSGSPGYNTALLRSMRNGQAHREPVYGVLNGVILVTGYNDVRWPGGPLPFFEKTTGSQSGCAICGAHYLHGDAWLHVPTGEVVLIGHMCADKMGTVPARGEWNANQKAMARLRKTAQYQRLRLEEDASKATASTAFLAKHEGLATALETNHYISRDLRAKLAQYGKLSVAQVVLARKIAYEATVQRDVPQLTPPSGRQLLTGRVVSLKDVPSDFGRGEVTKMLVEVAVEGGVYRVFGTAPYSILGPGLRGCQVRFSAEVQPKEVGFGFFSRPTNAEVLETGGAIVNSQTKKGCKGFNYHVFAFGADRCSICRAPRWEIPVPKKLGKKVVLS